VCVGGPRRNIAELSSDLLAAIVKEGAVEAACKVALRTNKTAPLVVAEAFGLILTTLQNPDVLARFAAADAPIVALSLELLVACPAHPTVVGNVFDTLNKLSADRYPCYTTAEGVTAVVRAMQACAGDTRIQFLGTAILLRLLPAMSDGIVVRSPIHCSSVHVP
jgi:Tfp pilus assembly protein FimV